jgi:hypothetical protein
MAAACAGYNEAKISDLGLKLKWPMPDSKHLKPPVDIAPSIAPRRLMKASRGKVNFPASLMKLFGDLGTGCATTYD